MRKIFFTALATILLLGAVFFVGEKKAAAPERSREASAAVPADDSYKKAEVKTGEKTFDALIADTPALREKGLSGRKGLGDGEAMLFVFDRPDVYGFWMKDMLFSIDIVWLDDDLRIISIAKDVSPSTFPKSFFPSRPAKYVLEFSAGVLGEIGVAEGDRMSIRTPLPVGK